MDHLHATAPDIAALVRASLGDANAFRGIVASHAPAMRRYVSRLIGHSSAAVEDILQEAFIKAYVNLNSYDQARPFGPWLYRIVHNEAINHLRRNRQAKHMIGGEDGALLIAGIAGENTAEPQPGLKAAIESAFDSLKQAYRDVLVLRLLEGKSYDEISDILAIPAGTAAIRIKRGLEMLRKQLAAWRD